MQFKTDRIAAEYTELEHLNPRLHALLQAADIFSSFNFGKEITLTSIVRTQEEQDALYKDVPPDKRPPRSPHLDHHAADLRSVCYTDQEIRKFVDYLNMFVVFGGQRHAALYHTIPGNAAHFHTQCPDKEPSA